MVGVHRLSDVEGGPITGYSAEIRIHCARCSEPFEFQGVEPGVDTQGARCSIDGQELRIAITPRGVKPSPFTRITANIRGFDA